ncbi:hypothetical protein P879_00770 [Paragonimus westermani]|uniref:non-specific protein-tyrosine kinase n=1 Tax=Paragonimus westermani TaxID=34504 RepID=A0A8T0DV03_9TREM|nr:hypothetical protein P879_00770 [Paragonimus westermani]
MISNRTFYPWNAENMTDIHGRIDPLTSFLSGICLQDFYSVCKKKLHIINPTQFAYYHPIELLQLGMTEADVNRLVGRLLDLGLPVGNLLSDTTATPGDFDLYGLRHLGSFDACAPPVDAHLYSRSHRPRLLRKLFGKKQAFHCSAPVSPAHQYELLSPSTLASCRHTSGSHHNGYRSHSYVARDPSPDHSAIYDRLARDPVGDGSRKPQTSAVPPLTCLIPEQDIKLCARIGLGSFGIVRRADWTTPSGEVIPVAVKLLRPGSMAGDHFMGFLDELRAMQCLSHPNLIRLHGVVLSNPIMMVTELAPLGSLLLHLRAQSLCAGSTSTLHCNSSVTNSTVPAVPTALQADALWDMSVQIARGMAYLSARGLVHRDLAARNILLAAVRKDEFPQVKIGDFGLVRAVATAARTDANKSVAGDNDELENKEAVDAVYTGRIEQRIPFAWSAPECLRKRVFSQASDVWSWAVTCWEIWTNGAAPWPGQDARQLLSLLETGRRLVWPRSICPRRFYQIMLACWRAESHRRPTFAYLAKRLNEIRPFEAVAIQTFDEADRLGLESGDVVVVLDGRPDQFWWRGQNKRTGELGAFPRSIVKRDGNLSPTDVRRPCTGYDGESTRTGRQDKLDLPISQFPSNCSIKQSVTYEMIKPSDKRSKPSVTKRTTGTTIRTTLLDDLVSMRNTDRAQDDIWCPMQDSLSIHSLSESRNLRSEDIYSCFSLDLLAPTSGAPCLDRYDDDGDDERAILDRTPNSLIGMNTEAAGNRTYGNIANRLTSCEPDVDTASDYSACFAYLPPPPGPTDEEDVDEAGSKPDHSNLPKHNSDTSYSADEPASPIWFSTPTGNLGTDAEPHPVISSTNSSITSTNTQSVSTEPLIDLYSQVFQPPSNNLRFPIPSAPIYQPHLPYYFPVYRPSIFGMGVSSVVPGTFTSTQPPTVFCTSVRPINDSFNLSASHHPSQPSTANTQTSPFDSDRLPNPPTEDPFMWDDLDRGRSRLDDQPRGSRSPLTNCTPSVSPIAPRVESQLLVGSAAPSNPFQSSSLSASQVATSTFPPYCTVSIQDLSAVNTSTFSNTAVFQSNVNYTAADQLAGEVACVCSQVTGCSDEEARCALAYLRNPFVSVPSYLTIPPLPSAPLYDAAVEPPGSLANETQKNVTSRIQLAVRLVLANRLSYLGLTSWDMCCQILSAFHWCLPTAADWLLDQRSANANLR